MGKLLVRYRWHYFDEIRGKYFTTSYWATEEDFLPSHPDATPIAGSRQELMTADDPLANCMARFGRPPEKP